MKTRAEMIEYFVELCGPHLDPDIFYMNEEELRESYENSIEESKTDLIEALRKS